MVKTTSLDALTSGKKSAQLKREILRRYTQNGGESIADLSRELGLSVPTLTKIVGENIISPVTSGMSPAASILPKRLNNDERNRITAIQAMSRPTMPPMTVRMRFSFST